MTASPASSGVWDTYRFGPFKLTVSSHTLSRSDVPLRIQDLPFQMLLLLVERRGYVVSKEELRDRLWGDKIHVEVDQNLYVIVAKLRELLGDDPVTPRFIKTVARRGYQFIGEVAPYLSERDLPGQNPSELSVPVPAWQAAAPLESVSQPTPNSLVLSPGSPANPGVPRARILKVFTRRTAIASFFVLLAAGISGIFLYRSFGRVIYKSGEPILIGAGQDEAGPAGFRPTLDFLIQLKLQESPFLTLIPERQLEQFKRQASFSTQEDQLKACSELKGKLLIRSRLSARGSGLRVEVDVFGCPGGKRLTTQWADADSEASLLTAVDLVTEKLRRNLGEPSASLERFDMPLTQSTTASLAALKKFTEGESKSLAGDSIGAIPDYKLAIDIDPRFALAYGRLGTIYINNQQPIVAAQYMQKAFDLRDRTTDKERLYITGHYYTDITGDLQHAMETYKLWSSLYPRDWGPLNNLANLYDLVGKPAQGLEYARMALQMNPGSNLSISTLAQAYLEHGDAFALSAVCHTYGDKNVLVVFHNICYLGALLRNDDSAAKHELAWAHGNQGESLLLVSAASAASERGRLQQAERLFSQARTNAVTNKIPEMLTEIDVNEAIARAEFGQPSQAALLVRNAQHSAGGATVPLGTVVLAIAGADREALQQAESAARKAPADEVVNHLELPVVQAILALNAKRPQQAIEALKAAQSLFLYAPMRFAPVFYQGEAYLANRQFDLAAKSFERILQNRSISADSVYIGLAALELGRALQLQGDPQGAAKAFTEARTLWAGADADFLPLKRLNKYQHDLSRIN
jgi:DNA-binding winged helix-turn-helix (wHTH) protein/tetratricopeptide (TPR) repeat protein